MFRFEPHPVHRRPNPSTVAFAPPPSPDVAEREIRRLQAELKKAEEAREEALTAANKEVTVQRPGPQPRRVRHSTLAQHILDRQGSRPALPPQTCFTHRSDPSYPLRLFHNPPPTMPVRRACLPP